MKIIKCLKISTVVSDQRIQGFYDQNKKTRIESNQALQIQKFYRKRQDFSQNNYKIKKIDRNSQKMTAKAQTANIN
ncbi:hypothetical protein TTHERM_000115459 (macronuclear) [Tetrahymena thermophila SB210]|uniref:Uncharacterized protein n=1 Tax=Tetrahymena thermophila (strain SB210) TaxID=312017 RepID=W7X8U9_TETTS|nr:hypothetical protein TTHERM_000115459 [Tetrahymena thermophila SB210]EWS75785.1 hypothetical protein TTHERM_000115459 [Tetrahymena thermophila SB210]|eukprot:XP_012651707.1 hypothetical protein TTHERM_000115459 [Tetrahymena thermophila SB210]